MPLTKVLQLTSSDCGQACLAMLTGLPLSEVWDAFEQLGLKGKRGKRKPFSSNARDLVRTAELLGFSLVRHRFAGWDHLTSPAILKTNVDSRGDWHWVVAEPHPDYAVIVHDPATVKGCWLRNAPVDASSLPIENYFVVGYCLTLSAGLKS